VTLGWLPAGGLPPEGSGVLGAARHLICEVQSLAFVERLLCA